MMLRVGVDRPDRLDPWPDRSGQARGLSGRPDRPAGLRQPWQKHKPQNYKQLKAASLSRRLIGLHWKRAGFRTLDIIQTHYYLDQPFVVDTPTISKDSLIQIHVYVQL